LRENSEELKENKFSIMTYKMFLDESGDHNLKVIDPNHPVFALVGCIFEENYY
jgi:hypothetical protein